MPTCCNNGTNFRKLCNNTYNGGKPYLKWEFMTDAPPDAETRIPHVLIGPHAPPALAREHWRASSEHAIAEAQTVRAEAEGARADEQTARAEAAERAVKDACAQHAIDNECRRAEDEDSRHRTSAMVVAQSDVIPTIGSMMGSRSMVVVVLCMCTTLKIYMCCFLLFCDFKG